MAIKYREAEELRKTTRQNLARSVGNWTRFLKTAGNTYKYSYSDQLLISAQFPNATAVASFDLWSERFGRRIRTGEKGIGLIDTSGSHPKIRYVFDISQSTANPKIPQPPIWQLEDDYKNDIAISLSADTNDSIENAISDFAENTVDERLEEHLQTLLARQSESTMLAELDEDTIREQFRELIFDSVKYTAFNRCGLEVDDGDMFRNLYAFSDLPVSNILGSAVSELSGIVLREIENRVKDFERRNTNEQTVSKSNQRNTVPVVRGSTDVLSDNEKGRTDRFDVQARSANIHISSVPDSRRGLEGHGDLGKKEREVSQREQTDTVHGDVRQSHTDGLSDRTQSAGGDNVRHDNGKSGERLGRDGGTESPRPNGMGTQSKSGSNDSGRTSEDRPDLRITEQSNTPTPKAEDKQSPAFFSTTHGEQISLIPKEKTEKDKLNEYAMSQLIEHGTGFMDGKFRVQEFFLQNHTKKEKAKFLSDAYGYGGYVNGADSAESRPNKGITMKHTDKSNPQNDMTIHLSYSEVADMIDYLIAEDLYITQKDIDERKRRAIYVLENYNPNEELNLSDIEYAKEVLDGYGIDYSNIVYKNRETVTNIDELLEGIPENAELPTEDYKVENESEVVEEFRRRTDEKFHTINGLTASDIEIEVKEQLEWAMQENEIAGKIRDVVLYGSRSRGIEDSEKADIDILVEVDGADMKEYALFNFFDELFLEVDGIPVDVNPIRPEQTGTLEDYLPTAEEYLEQQQAEKAKKEILSSDGKQEQEELSKTLEQENNQNETADEQDVVQYTVNFVTQSETYAGGYDSDGHERLDNYSLQQNETTFRIYTDYISKYDSNIPYGNYDIDTEQAIEEIESLFNKSIYDFEAQMQITDKDNKPVSVNDVLSYLKERAVSVEQENLTDKSIREKNKEIIDSLTVGSQIMLGGNSWKVTHINGDFSANLENLDKNSKMSDLSYMGFWKESLLDEAKDQPIIVITPKEEKVEQPKEEQAEIKTPLSREELIEKAKSIINDFVNEEYDDTKGADFSDLTKIDVAYTTTEDGEHEIQAYIDLENTSVIKKVDESVISVTKYATLEEFVEFLNDLEFSDLTYISDEQLGRFKENNPDEEDIKITSANVILEPSKVLDEKEKFFCECDLPSLLAKSSLAWDEIESLGYIFFEKGHIDKYPPISMAHYGNGFFAEPQVYELARKYQNGEDISKELTEKLFTSNGRVPSTNIPFKDSYVEDLDLNIRPTDTGYLVNYGAYSREVTFEEMATSYLHYFKSEYEDIQKAVAEEEKELAEKSAKINADDIKIGDKFEYKGTEYEVTHLSGVYPDDVGVSYIDKASNGLAYEVTSNIDKYTLASQGKYLGNSQQEEIQPEQVEQTEQAKDFAISDMALGQTKLSERFLNNLSAIRTLKQIENENRQATPEEQETLSKYAGWGGLAKVFDPENKHYSEVKELLTEDEFENAKRSTLTAFYTSPVIIKEMYAKLSEMGFENGKLLEPSCGVGNFIGMIPENMNAKVSGVELDSLTGRIAQKLYPNADIQVCGFENAKLKDNSFDVAVGNVPFGEFSIYDKKYNKDKLLIHDYFFSKSIDMVKSGGVVAFITSKGTLDKLDKKARTTLAEKAEFLGAVRLPNTAFKSNAGTEVTSDIIFLQKRENPITITPENEPLWLKTAKDENGIEMNAYFVEHPEQICGIMVMESTQYGMASTCQPNLDTKLSEQIRSAMANINGTISTAKVEDKQEIENSLDDVEVPENLRNGSYFLSNGKAYFFEADNITPVEFAKSKAKQSMERLTGIIAIRDTVRQLLDMQIDEYTSDEQIKAVQSTLSSLYDGFVQKYGRLNDVNNTSVFKNDSSLPLLKSLEKTNQKGEFIDKADIFTKRTVKAQKTVSKVDSAVDALAVSISSEKTKGKVDIEFMSNLTGMDKDKLIDDLHSLIYRLPNTETYVTADEYLSGDILEKLNAAKVAFDNGDTSMAVNISALEKAMPERLGAADIDVRLGTTWIKPEYIRDFVYDLLKTPNSNRMSFYPKEFIDVQYSEDTGKWNITNKSVNRGNALANTTYGTAFKSAYTIIEDMLNLKAQIAKDKVEEDGKVKYVINRERTAMLQSKAEKIEQKFQEWIFKDKARRDDLVNTYNEMFNSIRPREYDGSHLNFVGMNPEISLRPHQLNAVARCLYGGNTLLAHEVGAGKTFEMIAACMEGKRLGLHNKSLFCVPNHLTEQIGSDFLKLYPNANILIATKNDFTKENRQKLVAKIATGNYDAVIIGHSQLGMIPVSLERQEEFIRNQINQLERGIEELQSINAENFQVKQLEKSKARLEEKLKKLLDSRKDTDNVTFEQMGIDKLFLDEAHEFKNLFLSTKMSNVAGITTSDNVQKTADLYMKTQYLDEQTHGKGIVFATGTPISNSMCEMYNMQKYLQGDLLKKKHFEHFDSWATTFGDKVSKLELAPEGNSYRLATRFAKFHNLPELMAMFKECADIQTADTLNLPNLPECEIHNVAVQPTEYQKDLVDSLSERATKVHNRQVDPTEDNMLKITTDGKKIGLDQRLINPDLPDEPHTKVNMCVENVFGIWDKTQEQRSTQLIFCDTSTPKNDGSFNLYDDIKQKLVAKGIPENEIAFIHSANTEEAKEKLFAKVRAGDVRILIGSTKKMGAGTNVQTKLIASHDLDAPYKPSDMEQRRGRMVRQGNENPKVDLYRYCTQDTFDAYLFQMLERKQNFISQVMTSKNPQRRCDDIDEATLSYAEVKALCIGDPRIKEKMELDIDVAKLQLERKAYRDEQFSMEDKIDTLQNRIKGFEVSIPKNENDFLYYENNHQPVFDSDGKKVFAGITINGTTYTERKEANEALKDAYITACRQGNGHKDFVSAHCEYKGFNLSVMFDSFSQCYKARLEREGEYYFDLGTDNIGRMDNMLDKLKEMCKDKIARCAECKQALEDIQRDLGKPFPKEQEFMKKTARLAQLNAELDTDGKKNELGGLESELGDNLTQGNIPKR